MEGVGNEGKKRGGCWVEGAVSSPLRKRQSSQGGPSPPPPIPRANSSPFTLDVEQYI
jgi:hypothetical protein